MGVTCDDTVCSVSPHAYAMGGVYIGCDVAEHKEYHI